MAILLLLPFLFRTTSLALLAAWDGITAYSYCFLVLPICGWLAWERRDRLLAEHPAPGLAGFALLLAAAMAWTLGELSGTLVVSEFALVVMAQAIVIAMLGLRVARTLLFPLAYLLFLVPMGEALIPPLQTVTADITVAMLKLSGLPVRSNGLVIVLPTSTWVVAEACAGVKFLIASVALGALLSEMFLRSWRRRLLFMAVSVAVPIIANGLRAYAIVMIGYFSDNKYALGADHLLYGWILFALVLAGMVAIAVAMREGPQHDTVSPAAVGRSSASLPIAGLATLLILLTVRSGSAALESEPASAPLAPTIPLSVGGAWKPIRAKDPSPALFAGADRVWHQAYSDGANTIHLSLGYFVAERPGAEIASSSHRLAGSVPGEQSGERWQQTGTAHAPFNARSMSFGAGDKKRLLWNWYWVDGRYTGNPYLAKLLQLKVKLLHAPSAAAVIAISEDYDAAAVNEKTATQALDRFVQGLGNIGATQSAP